MANEILEAYAERPFLGTAMDETTAMVQEVEAQLAAKKEADAAAAAAAVEEEASADDEETKDAK